MLKNKPMQNNKLTRYTGSARGGFTILEILVVLVIIGIIVSVGLNMYLGQQKASRDAERKSNIHMISSALQNYYSVKKQYPAVNTLCKQGDFNFSCLTGAQSIWIDGLVSGGYIEGEIPNDPRFKSAQGTGPQAVTAMTSGGDTPYEGASGWYYGYTSKSTDPSYDQRFYVIFGALEKIDDSERFGTYKSTVSAGKRSYSAWDNNLFVVTSQ